MPYDAPFAMPGPKQPGQTERMPGPKSIGQIMLMPGPKSIGQIVWTQRGELGAVSFKTYSLQSGVQSMPKVSVDGTSEALSRVSPSRSASVTALASVLVMLVGIAGQMVENESVAFAMIAAFGLAVLAGIVLIHQRA